jgi:hypothetical protein
LRRPDAIPGQGPPLPERSEGPWRVEHPRSLRPRPSGARGREEELRVSSLPSPVSHSLSSLLSRLSN